MGGSGAFAGVYTLEHVRQQRDIDGIAFGEALNAIGYAGDAPVGGRALDAYFEAHIEQGPDPRARGQDRGRGDRSAGPALVRLHLDRPGRACRTNADGRRAAMHYAGLRAWSKRSTRWQCAMRPTAGATVGFIAGQPQLAQRRSGPRQNDRRHAASR